MKKLDCELYARFLLSSGLWSYENLDLSVSPRHYIYVNEEMGYNFFKEGNKYILYQEEAENRVEYLPIKNDGGLSKYIEYLYYDKKYGAGDYRSKDLEERVRHISKI